MNKNIYFSKVKFKDLYPGQCFIYRDRDGSLQYFITSVTPSSQRTFISPLTKFTLLVGGELIIRNFEPNMMLSYYGFELL